MLPLWLLLHHFFRSSVSIIHERINLTLICHVLIIRLVIRCLQLSRNDSGSHPFDHFIRYWIAKFFKADLNCVGWNKVSLFSYMFFNFVFKRLKHFVNHFWFWRYVIQQPFTKIFNLLFYILLIFRRDIWWPPSWWL